MKKIIYNNEYKGYFEKREEIKMNKKKLENQADGNNMLNIAYILGDFPVLSETFIANEIQFLKKNHHNVEIVSLTHYEGNCQPEHIPLKEEIHYLKNIDITGGIVYSLMHPIGVLNLMKFAVRQKEFPRKSLIFTAIKIAGKLSEYKIDHIHAHFANAPTAIAISVGKLMGISTSFIGHGYDIYGSPSDLKAKLESADFSIAVCQDMADDFRKISNKANIATIHCGVDADKFQPLRICQPYAKRNNKLLAIGRLAPQKGYPVLLKALAEIEAEERPIIDIVGVGKEEHELRHLVEKLKIADWIHFLGAKNSQWIRENAPFYSGFLAPYVVTENGDRDTGPLVVKEAMSMEIPVVASALMGLKEIVTEDCGRLIKSGDVYELRNAILWLKSLSKYDINLLGQAGRKRVLECYTIEKQANGLVQKIQQQKG